MAYHMEEAALHLFNIYINEGVIMITSLLSQLVIQFLYSGTVDDPVHQNKILEVCD